MNQSSEMKNPAKSLNATINLEQMLQSSKSGRVIGQANQNQRTNSIGMNGQLAQQKTPSRVNNPGDADPVHIASLPNDNSMIQKFQGGQTLAMQ